MNFTLLYFLNWLTHYYGPATTTAFCGAVCEQGETIFSSRFSRQVERLVLSSQLSSLVGSGFIWTKVGVPPQVPVLIGHLYWSRVSAAWAEHCSTFQGLNVKLIEV